MTKAVRDEKRAHEGRMRTYGQPESLLWGLTGNVNNVGAHPILMRAIVLWMTKGKNFVL